MLTPIDRGIRWTLLLRGAGLSAGAVALYFGGARLLALLPGEPLATTLRPIAVGLSALAYVVVAFDYVALVGACAERYPGREHRAALQAGTVAGTLVAKTIMLVLWAALSRWPLSIACMLLFALTQILAVNDLCLRETAGGSGPAGAAARWLRAILLFPNRLFAGVAQRTILPLDLDIPPGLSPRELFHRARGIPMATVHDMVVFVPLYREIGIVEFGVGVLVGNWLVSSLLILRPAPVIRTLRHPVPAVGTSLFLLVLAGMCGARCAQILFATFAAHR